MLTKSFPKPALAALLRGPIPGVLLSLLLAMPAAIPLLSEGWQATDDGNFHLFRLMSLDSAFHVGVFYPRLFPNFAFGYGYPVLNFYSPASYYLAEFFHLFGPGYIMSTKLMILTTLLGSSLFLYLWVASLFGRLPALLSAVAYVYFPYHLADAYVRGAFPEFAAFAFFPAILWCYHQLFFGEKHSHLELGNQARSKPIVWAAGASLATALLVLTHNLSALIFAPVILGYILLCAGLTKNVKGVLVAVLSLAIALGLSAFYWLPSLGEVKWVQIGQELGVASGYSKHLYTLSDYLSPFNLYHYKPNQATTAEFPWGRVQILVFALSLLSLPVAFRRSRLASLQALFFLVLTGLSAFLLLSASQGLWALLRTLSALQYPWRIEALLALSTSVLAALPLYVLQSAVDWRKLFEGAPGLLRPSRPVLQPAPADPVKAGRLAADGIRQVARLNRLRSPRNLISLVLFLFLGFALLLSGILNLPRGEKPVVEKDITVQRMWTDDAQANQIGATWTNEFTSIFVKEERWRIPRAAQDAQSQPATPLPPPPKVELARPNGFSWSLSVDSSEALKLATHAFFLPGWQGFVDGKAVDTEPAGSLGLPTIDIPAGNRAVKIEFGSTLLRDLGLVLALASLAVLGVLLLKSLSGRACLILVVAVLAVVVLAGFHLRSQSVGTYSPLDANLQNVAKLLGVETNRDSYRPGDAVEVQLFWLGWDLRGKDYKVFVHLVPRPGAPPVAQQDGDPVGGFTPTSRWAAGELVADAHEVKIPANLKPGIYSLEAGMYDPVSVKNLSVLGENGKVAGETVILKEISIAGQ